ncbi:MAG: hypothetical protein WCI55_04370 [Armatimonadota bacterium]
MKVLTCSTIGLLVFAMAVGHQFDATNFSGLKGQDLKPATFDIGKIKNVGDLLNAGSRLLEKKQNEGKVDSVHISEDRRESVRFKVSFHDLKQDGLTLSAFVSDDGIRPLGKFSTTNATLTGKEGDSILSIKLDSAVASGTELKSKYLVITIGKPASVSFSVIQAFELLKKWKRRELNVAAVPVGAAQSVPATAIGSGGTTTPGKKWVKVTPLLLNAPLIYKKDTGMIITQNSIPRSPSNATKTNPSNLDLSQINFDRLKPIGAVQGLSQDVKDSGGRGPDLQKGITLFDNFTSDVESLKAEQAIDVFSQVFEDANPLSNTYYYLPKSYKLAWDKDKGYGIKFLYGAQRTETDASVTIAARVTSGICQSDLNLLKTTLEAFCAANGKATPKLKPFPILNAPVCTLKGELARYNIPDDKVFVVEGSADASEFNIAITTDTVTKENIQLALTEGIGLNGFVKFKVGDTTDLSIPLTIKFADKESFGTKLLGRTPTSGSRIQLANPIPYPIRLDYIHVLRKSGLNYQVLSYALNGAEIPSGETTTLLTERIPGWLDANADTKRMWVDYSVMDDDDATQASVTAATGGVTSMTQGEITFNTLTPLADTGVKLVLLEVKSKHFDSSGSSETTKSLVIDKDSMLFKLGPVYLVNRRAETAKPGDILFQYRLKLIYADGREKQSKAWVQSNDLNLFLGKVHLQKVIDEPESE